MRLPTWLWGGNPGRFLEEARYRSGRNRDGSFWTQTDELFLRQPPALVERRTLAGPGTPLSHLAHLARLEERVDPPSGPWVTEALRSRSERAEKTGELLDVINHQQLLLYNLAVEALPEQAGCFLEFLRSVSFTHDKSQTPFPNPGVQLVQTDPALLHRLKFPSILLRIEQDEDLNRGDPRHVRKLSRSAETTFDSSTHLYRGVMLFDAYLAPLLAAGTPGIWALNVTRSFGSMIFDLGTLISGSEGFATEMIQLISIPGTDRITKFASLSQTAPVAATSWWTDQLNYLFSTLSDMSVFTDSAGWYQPSRHLEALLTIEQLFVRTTSLLVATRDANARRALMFTILDSLEGVRGANLLTMCSLKHARKTLERLETSIPGTAKELLLPSARRAVEALREMQDGFFIRRQQKTDRVSLRVGGSSFREMSVDDATARYLKLLRDATHGHGADKESTRAMTAALLAHHDGHVPHDVGLIAYLYLLDVLANPGRLRTLLYRTSRDR